MKKAFLIHYDGYFDIRLKYVEENLIQKGYKVTLIFSDFNHFTKSKKYYTNENVNLIKVPEYKKNISIKRIFSYLSFTKQVVKYIESKNPDLIYAIIPPNSLANSLAKYKKKNSNTKVIFDVFDLYPEQMPKLSNTYVAKMWGNLRNKSLKKVDFVILECEYYKKRLSKYLEDKKSEVLYLNREELDSPYELQWNEEQIDIAYLGSINYHIDIDAIVRFLNVLNEKKKVVLHVIGDGEKAEEFQEKVRATGVEISFYGKIFDNKQKRLILQKCQYGLNMYRDNLGIGLTMKAIEYYQMGLPILNSGIYDVTFLTDSYKSGININNIMANSNKISNLKKEEWQNMIKNSLLIFHLYFCDSKYKCKLNDCLDRVIGE